MLFNSINFILFFVVVYGLYTVLKHRAQNVLLLIASYFFYGCWDWRFLSLILVSTIIDYGCGRAIHQAKSEVRRRGLLTLSMVSNLSILFFFKYYGFFAESLNDLLMVVGLDTSIHALQFILPVGISFYTFQTMSYSIDIYRGELEPADDLLDFAVFVAFFPQLVAGPIERAKHLLPQVRLPRLITYDQIREGGWLILIGYYKKVVVADNMGPFVDVVFNDPTAAHGASIPIAVLAFAFQIYGDFSGYTDIARGVSKLMGFDIMLNFRMPYFATNPQEFWSRWHISLSSWLRDYLYIPLGGNRRGGWTTYRNLSLTMLLGGLWHGAAWHFVAWGAFHGALLIVHRRCKGWVEKWNSTRAGASAWVHPFFVLHFFCWTCFGWLLFRVDHLHDIVTLAKNTFSPWAFNGKVALLSIGCFFLPLLLLELWQERTRDLLVIKRAPPVVRLLIYSGILFLIILSGWVEEREFIYFQF